jgi:hypothetical protein
MSENEESERIRAMNTIRGFFWPEDASLKSNAFFWVWPSF